MSWPDLGTLVLSLLAVPLVCACPPASSSTSSRLAPLTLACPPGRLRTTTRPEKDVFQECLRVLAWRIRVGVVFVSTSAPSRSRKVSAVAEGEVWRSRICDHGQFVVFAVEVHRVKRYVKDRPISAERPTSRSLKSETPASPLYLEEAGVAFEQGLDLRLTASSQLHSSRSFTARSASLAEDGARHLAVDRLPSLVPPPAVSSSCHSVSQRGLSR